MSANDRDKNRWRGPSKMAASANNHTMCGRDKRGYRAPVKSALWDTGWDKKCKADFVDYVPPTNARLD